MIGPKTPKPTEADNRRAYDTATLRDGGVRVDKRVEGGICQRCLRDCGPIARDHRQNRDAFNTVPSNLQCLGLGCHLWKTEHPEDAIGEGWAVPKNTPLSPAEWPARRWLKTGLGTVRLAWVLYDDAGGWVEIDNREADYRRFKGGLTRKAAA